MSGTQLQNLPFETMPLSFLLLLSITLTLVTSRGCPGLNEVDIYRNLTTEKSVFIAGRFYSEVGHTIPELACNGDFKEPDSGDGDMNPRGDGEPMGSIMIYPGCKVYLFEKPDYEGDFVEYTGPAVMPKPDYLFQWACGSHSDPMLCPRSYLWTCIQTFPECYPEDGWSTITYLDNSQSNIETVFTFSQKIGVTWSHKEEQTNSISTTVKNAVTFKLFGMFEDTLEVSATTKFDWSQADTTTKEDAKTYTIQSTVPAGEKVRIEAAVGHCGGNTVETKMFRVVSTYTGKVIKMVN